MFLQSALETMFSPMAKRLLGFTAVENSITYVCIGVIAVVGYARKVLPRRYQGSTDISVIKRQLGEILGQYKCRTSSKLYSNVHFLFDQIRKRWCNSWKCKIRNAKIQRSNAAFIWTLRRAVEYSGFMNDFKIFFNPWNPDGPGLPWQYLVSQGPQDDMADGDIEIMISNNHPNSII